VHAVKPSAEEKLVLAKLILGLDCPESHLMCKHSGDASNNIVTRGGFDSLTR